LVQLVTRKSALVLYGVLLVLPTVVLGGLLWYRLQEDHATEMAAIPKETMNAKLRMQDELERRVQTLLDREGLRPFYVYKRNYYPPNTIGAEIALVPSPLTDEAVQDGILGWFTFPLESSDMSPIEVFGGMREQDPAVWPERSAELERWTTELARQDLASRPQRNTFRVGNVRVEPLPIAFAAINVSLELNVQCMRDALPELKALQGQNLDVKMSTFNLRFYRSDDGTPHVAAVRQVYIREEPRLLALPSCFDRLGHDLRLAQGFFIDPEWIFSRLPKRVASTILDSSQEFVASGPAPADVAPDAERVSYHAGAVVSDILPVQIFEMEIANPADETFGKMRIVGNTADLEDRFRDTSFHFLSVAAMLVVSLATGLVLLLRSVHKDLESAQRTENFVAAVTHELRTPLSAIRMHGEMLREGWVQEESKRHEYYRRIVRETNRLENMVERVLEKSRLSTAEATPEPGDVNAIVEGLGPALVGEGTEHHARDVVFELAPDLPDALVVPEGVRSIVTNLVENARKYAPVDASNGAEPIRVATLLDKGAPVLEVRDRGPGIPAAERSRIFDAFYRVGNERTRTTKGTGLGLHLAALHCEVMGAKIQALDREGGGTVFRVTFQPT
jgi:signal transduction histidine kinase